VQSSSPRTAATDVGPVTVHPPPIPGILSSGGRLDERKPGTRTLQAAGWALLVCAPVLTALARLRGHPNFFFDGEASIPATIGRELHLCGADLVFHYQVVAYQGSLVMDSLLSSVGYAVFGDHPLAWHVVPLMYVLLASAAGCLALHRTVGPIGALAWPLLLATAPFVVKDGLVSGIGGHPMGPTWGLAALALALQVEPEGRRRWAWALAAGAVLGLGTWHVRSTVVAGPAVLLPCILGGRKAVLGFAVGVLAFPALAAVNLFFMFRGTFWDDGAGWATAERLLHPGGQIQQQWSLTKIGEASGWSLGPAHFLQPRVFQSDPPVRAGWLISGRIVAATWLLALPAIVAAFAARARERASSQGSDGPRWSRLRLAALPALGLAWPAAYLLRPFRVEESLRRLLAAPMATSGAPTISETRYLVPICVGWLVVLAFAVGLCWKAGLRRLAVALLAIPVAIGGWHAALDVIRDGDRAADFAEMGAFYYPGIDLGGRLPPADVHIRCIGDDDSSNAYHLGALGRELHRGSGPILGEPSADADALRSALAELGERMPPDGDLAVARAMGRELGEQSAGLTGERLDDSVEAALLSTGEMPAALGMEYLTGFVRAMPPGLTHEDPGRWLAGLCERLPTARHPALCAP
jgi:hypothetical protein